MKPVCEMTQGEFAAFIDSHLRECGINVVRSGGASVAIYSDHKYVSKDLDFIGLFTLDHTRIESVMKEIGFERRGKYYHHPKTPYFVDSSQGQQPLDKTPLKVFMR